MKTLLISALPFVAWLGFVVSTGLHDKRDAVPQDVALIGRSLSIPIGWRCGRPEGCIAYVPKGGKLIGCWFAQGTRIEEKEGWVIDPHKGWKKVD